MQSWIATIAAVGVAGLLVVGAADAAEGKGKGKGKGEGKGAPAEKHFKKKDTNGDGKLTLEEFKAGMPAERSARADKVFARFDKNGDGSVTLEEFKAGHEQAQKQKQKKQ